MRYRDEQGWVYACERVSDESLVTAWEIVKRRGGERVTLGLKVQSRSTAQMVLDRYAQYKRYKKEVDDEA